MNHSTFTRDNRAVAPVIGFILMIGILVLLLAVYQAQIVPQQNAETELEHHQETRDELRSLDHAISAVGADKNPRFETIDLGTAYEDRTLGINPPPPAGTIRTEEHNISITNESGAGTQKNISTQFIEYQPGYNELDIGSTWYEHSVLYLDERDRGNNLNVIEDQQIVQDGNVTIVSLQNEFQETGTGRITFELYPKNDVNNITLPEPDGNYTVEIPTRLNGSEYWNETVGSEDIFNGVDETESNDDSYLLNLTVEPDALELDSVGISLEPDTIIELDDNGGQAGFVEVTSNVRSTGASGKYVFELNNTGDVDTEIVAIGVNNTSKDNIFNVDNGDILNTPENGDQIVEREIPIDSTNPEAERVSFNRNVELNAGSGNEREFEFDRFRVDNRPPGGSPNADMRGQDVTITIWLSDGSQTTLLLSKE